MGVGRMGRPGESLGGWSLVDKGRKRVARVLSGVRRRERTCQTRSYLGLSVRRVVVMGFRYHGFGSVPAVDHLLCSGVKTQTRPRHRFLHPRLEDANHTCPAGLPDQGTFGRKDRPRFSDGLTSS